MPLSLGVKTLVVYWSQSSSVRIRFGFRNVRCCNCFLTARYILCFLVKTLCALVIQSVTVGKAR